MANETIELLQNYKPENMAWPAAHQEKIDGVPVIIKCDPSGRWHPYTRQGEVITSINHIVREVAYLFNKHRDVELVGELHIEGLPFKTISGHVRKNLACPELKLHVFDVNVSEVYGRYTWEVRMGWLHHFLDIAHIDTPTQHISIIPWTVCHSPADAEMAHKALMAAKPKAEGSALHSLAKRWEPGKRSWHVQKMKPQPTIDLRVVGFEEAVSASKKPLGMVGRVLVEFTSVDAAGRLMTTTIGVGPGKLTHAERMALWRKYLTGNWSPRIAEIKYMRDDTYDALRQPTFQNWREDKTKPDTYHRA